MAIKVPKSLTEALGMSKKSSEAEDAFAKRVAKKAEDIPEEDWKELSEDDQRWVNSVLEAIDKGTALPGADDDVDDDAGGDSSDGEEEEEKPKRGGKAKATAAKKPTAASKKPASKKPAASAKTADAEKPAPKAKAKTAKDGGGKRGPRGLFTDDDKIKVLVKENPFRAGTKNAKFFDKYAAGMTVGEALKAGVPRNKLRRHQRMGHIKIGSGT